MISMTTHFRRISAEAKKIMSVEHKVLGFRPPQGSFAAEAQAAAAKHPDVQGGQLDSEKLKEAAKIDAQRILYVCHSFYLISW